MVGFYYMPVVHETHGEGKITAWDGRTITVRFQDVEKRYWFPVVFIAGKLNTKTEKDKALMQEMIDRWTESVIVREAVSLGVQYTDAEKNEVVTRICTILKDAYSQDEIAHRIEKILEERKKKSEEKQEAASKDNKGDEGQSAKKQLQFTRKSDFTGGMFAYFGIQLLTVLATAFSLGIAYPFMTCWRLRWEAEHTVIDGQTLTFDGTGKQLFGKYIIWWLLSVVTFGVYALIWLPLHLNRWIVKHTHFAGATKAVSKFDGNIWQYFGVRLVARLVTGATLGFGSFWAHCYLERWQAKHTSYDGYRLQFDGTGMQYFGKCIVWVLLTIVTFGIYSFWLVIKEKKWTMSHTHVA